MTKAYWCKDWVHPNPREAPFNVHTGPKLEEGDLVIRSDNAKRVLAGFLRENDPWFLEQLMAAGKAFGLVTVIMADDQELRARLDDGRREE